MLATVLVALLAAAPGTAVLSLATGPVEIERGGKWQPLAQGASVSEGERVRTGAKCRAELKFPDGTRVRLAESTDVLLDASKWDARKRESVSLTLKLGRLWSRVAKSEGAAQSFEVKTANAVSGVRGTTFAVLAAADASAIVRVYAGSVGVKKGVGQGGERKQVPGPQQIDRQQWEEIVAGAMKQVKISQTGDLSPAEDFEDKGSDLEWAKWNQSRDAGSGVPD